MRDTAYWCLQEGGILHIGQQGGILQTGHEGGIHHTGQKEGYSMLARREARREGYITQPSRERCTWYTDPDRGILYSGQKEGIQQ